MLKYGSYQQHEDGNPLSLISNLVLGIDKVEKVSGRLANFREDGVVEFYRGDRILHVLVGSGGGVKNFAMMQLEISNRRSNLRKSGTVFSIALVAGVVNNYDVSTPDDIVAGTDRHDLVGGYERLEIFDINELIVDSGLVEEVFK